jgi:enoyl-CoA hydratase/carnithine racemase
MQHVDVKIHQNIATILMDCPKSCNSLSPAHVEDLMTAFSDVHQEKGVTAVVLSGSGSDFCAGMDLGVMDQIASMPPNEAAAEWFNVWNQLIRLIEQILRFPKPVVAAVDGSALGAGLSLALAADIIVASNTASFGSVAVRRGLAGTTSTALLAFRFGSALAARLSLTGQTVDASEAYRLGICDKPVESSMVWVTAVDWAKRCSQAPREAIQATKKVLNEEIGETLLTQLNAGAALGASICTTDPAMEGIKAFCEKRQPDWLS